MKRYLILVIIIACNLFIDAKDRASVLFVNSDTITAVLKDSASSDVQMNSKVDTLGLTENVSNEKPHGMSMNVDTLKKIPSSTVKEVEKSKTKVSSGIKKQNTPTLSNSVQDFSIVAISIDSLKYDIESMSQTNDSLWKVLLEISNKSEKTFKLYSNFSLFLGTVSLLLIIVVIIYTLIARKKYKEIITSNGKEHTDVAALLQNCISLMEEMQPDLIGKMQSCTNDVTRVLNQVSQIEISLKTIEEETNVVLSKLSDIPIVQPTNYTPAYKHSVESEEAVSVKNSTNYPQITEVQYNDAISEFERINNRLFKLRKHKFYPQELLRFLSSGEMNKDEYTKRLGESDLSEDVKDHLSTILYDIERFNAQRREFISLYILQQNLPCFDIRFPLSAVFDDELDHHFKGDDVADGEKIMRVCKLGYYFPNSRVAPYRVKSEIDTEKKE